MGFGFSVTYLGNGGDNLDGCGSNGGARVGVDAPGAGRGDGIRVTTAGTSSYLRYCFNETNHDPPGDS